MKNDDEMLTTEEAARLLGMKTGALAMRRSLGLEPAYHKLGHAVRYKRCDLLAYIADSKVKVRPRRVSA